MVVVGNRDQSRINLQCNNSKQYFLSGEYRVTTYDVIRTVNVRVQHATSSYFLAFCFKQQFSFQFLFFLKYFAAAVKMLGRFLVSAESGMV